MTIRKSLNTTLQDTLRLFRLCPIRDVSMQIADYVSAAIEADKDMLGLCQKAELATSETAALNYARQAQDKASDAGYNLDRAIDLCEYFSEYSGAKAN